MSISRLIAFTLTQHLIWCILCGLSSSFRLPPIQTRFKSIAQQFVRVGSVINSQKPTVSSHQTSNDDDNNNIRATLKSHLVVVENTEQKRHDDFVAAKSFRNNEAKDRIVLAAEAGDPLAEGYASILLYRGFGFLEKNGLIAENYAVKALPTLKEKALNGNKFALFILGTIYYKGIGVMKDEKGAVKWFELAAEQGHAGAQCYLGVCYQFGKGTSKDVKEAVKYYKLAADQGLTDAQYALGDCYEEGIGVTKDEVEAVKYYRLAADQGCTEGLWCLGYCYKYGIGVEKDEKEAARYDKLSEGYVV